MPKFSKTTGAAASAVAMVAGVGTVLESLLKPETAECVRTVANAFGPHVVAGAVAVLGGLTAVAPVISWMSEHPQAPTVEAPAAAPTGGAV